MPAHLLIFLAGLAGSMHCIGMCGGFACGLGNDPRGAAATALRHGVYNLGRLSSYCFIGALVGHGGVWLVAVCGGESAAGTAQRVLAVVSGGLMLWIGLQFLGFLQRAHHASINPAGAWLAGALRKLVRAPGLGAPLAFGVLNGFLPCPLVYAFAAQAAASDGALPGLLVMAAFGLGTFPAMLLMGGLGARWQGRTGAAAPTATLRFLPARSTLRADWRLNGVRLAGAFIVLLGLITLARGLLPMSAHLH